MDGIVTESPRKNDKDIDEILTKVRSPTQTATARSITKKGQCGMLAKDCAEICVCVCARGCMGFRRQDSREAALCSKLLL